MTYIRSLMNLIIFFVNIGSDLAKKISVMDNISLDSFLRIIIIHCFYHLLLKKFYM